ncbi:MAG: type III pantothenate kinase, partial [Tangfeifania sp.]
MLLAIDIGNTNIVFGIYEERKLQNNWHIQTDQRKTADEYEVIFRSLMTAGKVYRSHVDKIILSSVVPSLVYPFSEMLSVLFKEADIIIVGPE